MQRDISFCVCVWEESCYFVSCLEAIGADPEASDILPLKSGLCTY
jgi:hypothetical protein